MGLTPLPAMPCLEDCVCVTSETLAVPGMTADMLLIKWSLFTGLLVVLVFISCWVLCVFVSCMLQRSRNTQQNIDVSTRSSFFKTSQPTKPRITFKPRPVGRPFDSMTSELSFESVPFIPSFQCQGSPKESPPIRRSRQRTNSLFVPKSQLYIESPLEEIGVSSITNHYLSKACMQTFPRSSTPKNPRISFSAVYPMEVIPDVTPSRV